MRTCRKRRLMVRRLSALGVRKVKPSGGIFGTLLAVLTLTRDAPAEWHLWGSRGLSQRAVPGKREKEKMKRVTRGLMLRRICD
ncbi:hypothetical protein BS50DRAFT_674569, partial [Corynespora cassiicola Philippines]